MSILTRYGSVLCNKVNASAILYRNSKVKMHIFNCRKILLSSNNHCSGSSTLKRTFFSATLTELFKRPKKADLKILDNIPDQYTLIYRNTMHRYILISQIVTTVSAVVVAFITVVLHDMKNYKAKVSPQKPGGETKVQRFVYLATFIFFAIVLQMLIHKLPIRIYYLSQQKTYSYVFYGNYPFTYRKLSCSVGEVAKLPQKGISPWKDAKYLIKDQQEVILMEEYFRRPADLYIMLGVQRDPDDEI